MSCFALRILPLCFMLAVPVKWHLGYAMGGGGKITNNINYNEEKADVRIGLHDGYTRLVIEFENEKYIKTLFNESASNLQIKVHNSKIKVFNISDVSSVKSPIEMLKNKNAGEDTVLSLMLKPKTQILRSFEINEQGKYRYVVDFAMPSTDGNFNQISQIIAMTENAPEFEGEDKTGLSKTLIAKLDEESDNLLNPRDTNFTDNYIYKETKKYKPRVAGKTSVAYSNKKPVIVIDAGHGGEDAGAISYKYKVKEKDITIRYAMLIYAKLKEVGKYDVRLTRKGDYFISLHKRLDMVQKYDADLFISVHADSHPNKSTKGMSVYTVSEQASDDIAKNLAHEHDEGQVIGGVRFNQKDRVLSNLLISLERRKSSNDSVHFADVLTKYIRASGVQTLYNTHRLAGFAVLKGPDVPSILLELGFLSNPAEERLLLSKEHRHKITDAVVKSVNDFMTKSTSAR